MLLLGALFYALLTSVVIGANVESRKSRKNNKTDLRPSGSLRDRKNVPRNFNYESWGDVRKSKPGASSRIDYMLVDEIDLEMYQTNRDHNIPLDRKGTVRSNYRKDPFRMGLSAKTSSRSKKV